MLATYFENLSAFTVNSLLQYSFLQIFLIPYAVSFLMNIGRLFTFDAEIFQLSQAFLVLTLIFLFTCQVILYHHLENFEMKLRISGNGKF